MIRSVLKALDVLEMLARGQRQWGVTELSEQLGYSKSTVHNLLSTLKSRDYVELDPRTNRYSLGMKLLSISQSIRVNIDLRDRAAPLLRELARLTGEAVYLTTLVDDHSVYIYAIEPTGRSANRSTIGERVPLHCTSLGKAKMAWLTEEEIDLIIERVGLPRFTAKTITDPAQLKEELAVIRRQGYAVDKEEHEVAICCIGAPIRDETGAVTAACSVSGPAGRMTEERIVELAPEVIRVADVISRRLGYDGSIPKQVIADAAYSVLQAAPD